MNAQIADERKLNLAKFFILMGAARYSETKVVAEMLDEGVTVNITAADVDAEGFNRDTEAATMDKADTPLLYAVRHNANFAMIKFLVERGANVNARDSSNQTALMIAKEKGREDTVYLLETTIA